MTKRQKIRKTIILVSFLFFPATFYYMSPYLIIDGTLNRVISGSFIFFTLLFLFALVFGRAFCGWICPAGGIQDIIIEVKNRNIEKGNLIKWLIWVPWISAIVIIAVKNRGYQRIEPFYQTTFGLSINNVYALITYLFVLALIVIPAFLVGRRSFCHSICWMAPFMILGRKLRNILKIPSLKLFSFPESCVHCHTCAENCPMSLPVEEMVNLSKMENIECILCGTCVDGCKSNSIDYKFNRS